MSLNRLFEDDSGFFGNIMDLIAKRSFNIEYVCGLVKGWTRIFELFSPLPPKLRIFSVDYYRNFEAQKNGIWTSPRLVYDKVLYVAYAVIF